MNVSVKGSREIDVFQVRVVGYGVTKVVRSTVLRNQRVLLIMQAKPGFLFTLASNSESEFWAT
jgi:hypothetical protein